MKRFEVTFDGGISGEDVEVTMSGTAKVEAEDAAQAEDLGFKKIMELNVFFEDQQVEWEHVRTVEECNYQCKVCTAPCLGGEVNHGKGCYVVSKDGGGTSACSYCEMSHGI